MQDREKHWTQEEEEDDEELPWQDNGQKHKPIVAEDLSPDGVDQTEDDGIGPHVEGGHRIFNELAFGVIDTLEAHPSVGDIKLQTHVGADDTVLDLWEQQHLPLPEDLKGFLSIFNGVSLQWDLRFRNEAVRFGMIHINSLDQLQPMALTDLQSSPAHFQKKGKVVSCREIGYQPVAAFDLDVECKVGKVVLLFWGPYNTSGETDQDSQGGSTGQCPMEAFTMQGLMPEVWLFDLSCRWNFIADSFSAYFRLLILHMGVPQWQTAYTLGCVDPVTQHWLALFCPERLNLKLEHGSKIFSKPCGKSALQSSQMSASEMGAPNSVRRHSSQRKRSSSASRRNCSGSSTPGTGVCSVVGSSSGQCSSVGLERHRDHNVRGGTQR